MGEDFARLAAPFGLRLAPALRDDVRLLADCIECVDRIIDATDDPAERRRTAVAIVRSLRTGEPFTSRHADLRACMSELRALVERRRIAPAFAGLAEEVLENTEGVRACSSHDEYVERTAREGRLAASMALLVAGDACSSAFARFLLALAEPANLVDKLVDARADAARGEIALAPDAKLHARLTAEVLRRLPPLLRLHPRPAWLLAWGVRSTLGLALPALRETRASARRSSAGTAGTSCVPQESTR